MSSAKYREKGQHSSATYLALLRKDTIDRKTTWIFLEVLCKASPGKETYRHWRTCTLFVHTFRYVTHAY